MVLHICQDEKFINAANESFEKIVPNENIFCVFTKDPQQGLKHVQLKANVIIHDVSDFDQIELLVKNAKIIFFHSYVPQFDIVFSFSRLEQILIWFCFGMEIYNDALLYKRQLLFDQETNLKYPLPRKPLKEQFKNLIRPYYRMIKPTFPLNSHEKKKAQTKFKLKYLNKIDYIANSYEEEFSEIQKLSGLNKNWFPFWYFPLEYMVDTYTTTINSKTSLMVGNSGHISNNHLDVIQKIEHFKINYNQIIFPLSYGNQKYIENLTEKIYRTFPNSGNILNSFLELEDYIELMSSVSVFILDARRQQAVGTIVPVLWHGAKVFLSNKNTFYHFLKRIGLIVYCYETELTEKTINEGLTLQEINHNRDILYKHLNEKHLLEQLKQQLDKIL
jgi:hypothetical protein